MPKSAYALMLKQPFMQPFRQLLKQERHTSTLRANIQAIFPSLLLGATVLTLSACSAPTSSSWTGYVEGEYLYISSPLGGRIEQLQVQAGQEVTQQAPLFTLDKEAELDNAVLRGAVDVRLDGGLGSDARETVAKTASLTRYVDRPSTGAVNYLALIPTAAPLDRLACRQAIAQALDISELITIRGGTDVMRTTDKMSSPRFIAR